MKHWRLLALAFCGLLAIPLIGQAQVPVVGPQTYTFTAGSQSNVWTCNGGQSSFALTVPSGLTGTFTVTVGQAMGSATSNPPWSYAPGAAAYTNTITNSGSLTVNLGSNLYVKVADTSYSSGSVTVTGVCSSAVAVIPPQSTFQVAIGCIGSATASPTPVGYYGIAVCAQATASPTPQPGSIAVTGGVSGSYVLVSTGLNTNTSVASGQYHGIFEGTYDPTYGTVHNNFLSMVQLEATPLPGNGDIAIGPCALCNGDSGTTGLNIGIGGGAMEGNVITGYMNIAIGYWGLRYLTSGYHNLALGTAAAQGSSGTPITGNDNNCLGYASCALLSSGSNNVFDGSEAGTNISSAGSDTGIGYGALGNDTGGNNTSVGADSGSANTSGTADTFLGYISGIDNTTGSYNTFLGAASGQQNTSGLSNSFIGSGAGYSETTSNYNTFVGATSGYEATGANNTLLGFESGYGLTTGSSNVLLGGSYNAASYGQVTSGSNNVAIGYNIAIPSQTANGQLDILNALYGNGNTGTTTTISTGCLGFYMTTCTNGTIASAVPFVGVHNACSSTSGVPCSFTVSFAVASGTTGSTTTTVPASSVCTLTRNGSDTSTGLSQWTASLSSTTLTTSVLFASSQTSITAAANGTCL